MMGFELTDHRKALRLTKKSLAMLAGVSGRTLYEYELGLRPIPKYRAAQLQFLFDGIRAGTVTPPPRGAPRIPPAKRKRFHKLREWLRRRL